MLRYLWAVIKTLAQAANIIFWSHVPNKVRWWLSEQSCSRDWRVSSTARPFHQVYWWLDRSLPTIILLRSLNSVAYFDPHHNGATDLGYITSDGRCVYR